MKEAVNDYLSVSDDIYSWLSTIYEKDESGTHHLYFDQIYEKFINGSFFSNLSKKDKRELNNKAFTTKINNNIFLQKFIKMRDTTYNSIKHKKPYIIGFKLIEIEDDSTIGTQVSPLDM